MKLTRREFLKICRNSAIGLGISQLYIPQVVEALEQAAAGKPPVLWLQGAGCNGCSVSLLNTAHPSISEVLLKVISLRYHPTVMAASGHLAFETIYETARQAEGKLILIVEGAIPVANGGRYCTIGEKGGKHITMLDAVTELGSKAAAIVAVGACATFGGIPAGKPNPTEAKGVGEILKGKAVLNITGCPSHPDWIVGSLVHVLLYGLPKLDNYGRPTLFFGQNIHQNCPNYSYYSEAKFAQKLGDDGCLIGLGCKGPVTNSDCPLRRWNSGVNWCVGSGAPCIGCCSTNFPDAVSPIYTSLPEDKWPERDFAKNTQKTAKA